MWMYTYISKYIIPREKINLILVKGLLGLTEKRTLRRLNLELFLKVDKKLAFDSHVILLDFT